MKKGLTHVYTGDGKGKTTAALGLILRASGRGMRIVLVQFFKGSDMGELHALKNLCDVTVLRYGRDYGFYEHANEQDRAAMIQLNNKNLYEASCMVDNNLCDLLVLDEICAAYNYGAVDTELVDKLVLDKPNTLELVLTGRNAPQHFIDAADYVTEFVKRKPLYDDGIMSRARELKVLGRCPNPRTF